METVKFTAIQVKGWVFKRYQKPAACEGESGGIRLKEGLQAAGNVSCLQPWPPAGDQAWLCFPALPAASLPPAAPFPLRGPASYSV